MRTVRNAGPAYRCIAVAVAALGLSAQAAAGADSQPAPVKLFDGKSLDGWARTDFANPGEVKVHDGAIILSRGRSMTGITSTRTDLPRANYELSYEAKRLEGRDFFAAATFPVGDAFLTFINGGWGGSVTGVSSLDGMDASENETSHYVKYENETWYKFRVRVTATTVRCWVDDKEVVAVNTEDRKLGTRLESRASQPLGFATWDTAGALRNIALRRLTPAEANANHKPQP